MCFDSNFRRDQVRIFIIKMRKIILTDNDFSMFSNDITPVDYDFFQRHKDAFKRMWTEQVSFLADDDSPLLVSYSDYIFESVSKEGDSNTLVLCHHIVFHSITNTPNYCHAKECSPLIRV